MTKKNNGFDQNMDDTKSSEDARGEEATRKPGTSESGPQLVDCDKEQAGLSYPLFRFFDQSGAKHVVLSCEVPARRNPRVVTYHLFPSKGWSDGSEVTPADVTMIKQRLKERAKKAGFSHAHIDIHT
jgi:hypothetical protein